MRPILRALDLEGSAVTAVLGPTNTGKTHRALQAISGSRSGMIGLPLRLLAREVYDRLRAEKGDDVVALVTGEEKRVPPGARYFACTVEAMPLDRATDIVVVDEVQLAAHRTRGHVFTDRILNARGLRHTMFLGSDTMAPLLEEMVPSIQISSQTRLSALNHVEPRKLTSLPKRSAVIGFSVARVYELAERLKARHGGAAVVLGALSPRARNAQVAMYQSGEVPYIVATDAIGMGLNLDVDHVAFSATRKWDGRSQRELSPAELAQIAGRAGRFTRDGTFSTLTETEPLSGSVIEAIENHSFRPVDEVWWRASDLDLDSLDGLLASLQLPTRRPYLRRMRDADDHQLLQQLASQDAIALRATSPQRIELLWQVAQVPDFRKTLTDSHAELMGRIYVQLVDHGRLADRWVEARIDRLNNVNGDLDALMTRIAWVRTWSYLSQRRGWFADGPAWQAKTREIEERLSDAVHDALTRRFVERRLRLRLADLSGFVRLDNDAVVVDEEIVGVVRGLSYTPMTGVKLTGEVRAEVISRIAALATACSTAADSEFGLSAEHALLWDDRVVGRFEAGDDWRSPRLRLARTVDLPVALRGQLSARLARVGQEAVAGLLEPVTPSKELSTAARALLYQLERHLLTVKRNNVEEWVRELTPEDKKALSRRDVRIGRLAVYVASRLKPLYVEQRNWLDAVARGVRPLPDPPHAQAMSLPVGERKPTEWLRLGFWVAGPRAVRVDVAEKVSALIRKHQRKNAGLPDGLASLLGCKRDQEEAVALALVPPHRRRRR